MLLLVLAALLAYAVGLVVYRLVFHPLCPFPGPTLAAATLWYEFYYDVLLEGRFIWKIQQMHEQYGKSMDMDMDMDSGQGQWTG